MTFKTLRRRGASLFLALTMCVSLLQVPAYAVEDVPETTAPVTTEAAEPLLEPAPAPAPEPEPEVTPAPPAADVPQETTPEPEPEPTPEVPPVSEDPAPDGESGDVPPVVDENTPQEPDNTVTPDTDDETSDPAPSETPEDVDDTISPEVQAFLDAVKALEEATIAGADFDTLLALAETCQNAYSALSEEDLNREDVASAVVQLQGLMPEEPVTLNEDVEEVVPTEGKREVKTLAELNDALAEQSVNVITLANNIVGNITIGHSLTLDLGGFTLTGTGNGSVVTTTNSGSDEVNVTIQNGTITGGNAAKGGGVFVGNDTTVTLANSGEISKNVAEYEEGYRGKPDAPGNGGGVFIENSGTFILDGGTIKDNACKIDPFEMKRDINTCGGGIFADSGSSFIMKSGSITGNIANRKGGGICLGLDGKGSVNVTIESGDITDNTADTGAGIYVARGTELGMQRVTVSNNKANANDRYGIGGGIWFCGTGIGKFYATNGAYISDNSAAKRGDDFSTQGADGLVSIPTHLYDGTKVEWYLDGTGFSGPRCTSDSTPIADMNTLINQWKQHVAESGYFYDDLELHSKTSGSSDDDFYTVRITGNTSLSYGGGIACNGTLIMGENKDISLKVNKVWNVEEGATLPESITVNVLNNGKIIDTITLNAANDWSAIIDGLPSDGTNYTLQEVSADGYDVSYGELVKGEDDTWSLSVTNSTPQPKTTSLTINKAWADSDTNSHDSDTVTVNVLNGSGEVVETVSLSAGNSWSATVDNLPLDGAPYTAQEVAFEGYTPSYSTTDGSVTITNTPVVPETTSLTINKVWNVEEGTTLPESITASVYNGETLVANVTLNAANQWTATLSNLSTDGKYSVSEVTVPGYTPSISGGQTADGTWSFTITNTPNIVVPETTTLTVNKVWSDGADAHINGSVIVNVLDAMNEIFKTVTLNAGNNWTAIVDGLSVDVKYTVQEVAVNGYTPSYTENEDGSITITNTLVPPPPERPDRPSRPDRPTTPPTTDIPDPDVPLAPGPDPEEPPVIIEEPDVPLAELPPEVEIPEPEVPLAGQPPVTTTIPEPEVPLADVPMTGDASGLWYALMGLAACGLVVLNLRKKEEA